MDVYERVRVCLLICRSLATSERDIAHSQDRYTYSNTYVYSNDIELGMSELLLRLYGNLTGNLGKTPNAWCY